jgi:nucleotide-binding universal stress UspA family protein
MSQKILCPTDLTVNSKDGVAYGFSLAKKNDAQLIIFHATSFPNLDQYPCCELESFYQWEHLVSKFKVDHLLAEAEREVMSFVCGKFETESKGVAWKSKVALGRPAEEIVVAAVQEEVDLIVLARRKARTLARFFTRSISETVTRNAPCPVLSIDATQFIQPPSVWRRVPLLSEIVQSS